MGLRYLFSCSLPFTLAIIILYIYTLIVVILDIILLFPLCSFDYILDEKTKKDMLNCYRCIRKY